MLRSTRLVGAMVLAAALGAGSLTYATAGQLTKPAAVSNLAARLARPTGPVRPAAQQAGYPVLALVNAERARAGLPALGWDDRVATAAQAHSADMAAHQRMDHTGSDGSNAGTRLTRAGFTWSSWGENIGAGFTTADAIFAAWMNSPSHRAHLFGDFTRIGVAAVAAGDGTVYWTLVVAR